MRCEMDPHFDDSPSICFDDYSTCSSLIGANNHSSESQEINQLSLTPENYDFHFESKPSQTPRKSRKTCSRKDKSSDKSLIGPVVMKKRRLAANARERRRVRRLTFDLSVSFMIIVFCLFRCTASTSPSTVYVRWCLASGRTPSSPSTKRFKWPNSTSRRSAKSLVWKLRSDTRKQYPSVCYKYVS